MEESNGGLRSVAIIMGAQKGVQSGLEYSPAGPLTKVDKSKEVRHITKRRFAFSNVRPRLVSIYHPPLPLFIAHGT
jgi:hypothetical protein